MIELTKLVVGERLSKMSQPVDPVRKTQKSGDNRKEQTNKAPVAAKEKTTESNQETTHKQIQDTLDSANEGLSGLNISLSLKIDEAADKLVVSLIEDDTGEIVRQFPPDELLSLSAKLKEVIEGMQKKNGLVGFLVDHKG